MRLNISSHDEVADSIQTNTHGHVDFSNGLSTVLSYDECVGLGSGGWGGMGRGQDWPDSCVGVCVGVCMYGEYTHGSHTVIL